MLTIYLIKSTVFIYIYIYIYIYILYIYIYITAKNNKTIQIVLTIKNLIYSYDDKVILLAAVTPVFYVD